MKEHFNELLNKGSIINETEQIPYGPQPEIEKPTRNAFNAAIIKLKTNRAPGEEDITSEVVKNSSKKYNDAIYKLICCTCKNEEMPKDWSNVILCPIFKKGIGEECANYRGIMLLSIPYIILSILLLKSQEAEKILNEYQCGFRNRKGTTDQIIIIMQIMEKSLEFNTDVYLLFIVYRQAFDSLNRLATTIALTNNGEALLTACGKSALMETML